MANRKFQQFIDSIDESVAGRDEHGGLRWHVAGSALENAQDTLVETLGVEKAKAYSSAGWNELVEEEALKQAEFILDDWRAYFPQLDT
jgi:hypothetical protein